MAELVAPGDAPCKPLLPELYEPVLTSIGNGLLVLRGFEREGEEEWLCVWVANAPYADIG